MQKIINAVFIDKNKDQVYTEKVYQYDYGRVLRIQGLDLPAAVKIEFAIKGKEEISDTRIGIAKDRITDVPIPDSVLENNFTTQDYYVDVFIYIDTGDYGQTIKKIEMPIESRPKPEPFDKPEEAELFREAIITVNESAERAEAAEKSAEAWNHGHVDYPERDNDNAMYYAKEAEKSAEHAEQAAKESGYIQFLIIDGRLIEIRTENVNVNFELREGRLVINA